MPPAVLARSYNATDTGSTSRSRSIIRTEATEGGAMPSATTYWPRPAADPAARGRSRERAGAAVHGARRVRAAGRRVGLDVGVHRGTRPARRRGEGRPAGAHAHGRRWLADRRASRPPYPLAPDRQRGAAAHRGRRPHLRLHRGRQPAGTATGCWSWPGPPRPTARPAPAAHPDGLGRLRQPGARSVDQPALGHGPRPRASSRRPGCSDEAQLFLASHRRRRAGRAGPAGLGPDRIEQRYEQFLAEFSAAPGAPPTRWPGSPSWCTPGAGSRGPTRCCRPSCCRTAGAGRGPRLFAGRHAAW